MANSLINKMKRFTESLTESNQEGSHGQKYLDYYNPNKEIVGKTKCYCRVMPNKNPDQVFFHRFLKHSFKIGTSRKTCMCTYTLNPLTDTTLDTSCPFCDFLEENREELSKDAYKALLSKEAYAVLVYNYTTDTIQKYEMNYYDSKALFALIYEYIEEDESIMNDGFDIVFKKEDGYARIDKISKSKYPVSEILEKSNNVKEIPDIYAEYNLNITDKFKEKREQMLIYALKALAPTFVPKVAEHEEPVSKPQYSNDIEDDIPAALRTKAPVEEPSGDFEIDFTSPEDDGPQLKAAPKATETVVKKEVIAEPDSDDADDIRSFVANLKKQKGIE